MSVMLWLRSRMLTMPVLTAEPKKLWDKLTFVSAVLLLSALLMASAPSSLSLFFLSQL